MIFSPREMEQNKLDVVADTRRRMAVFGCNVI